MAPDPLINPTYFYLFPHRLPLSSPIYTTPYTPVQSTNSYSHTMRLQLATLALLASATSVVADDVVSLLFPSEAAGFDAKLVGTVHPPSHPYPAKFFSSPPPNPVQTGGDLTTLIINCPATASATGTITSAGAATTSAAVAKRATTASSDDDDDDDDECDIPAAGRTLTAGSSTWAMTYSGTDLDEQASCTYSGTTWMSCALTISMDGQVSSDSATTTTTIPKVAITITSTVSATGSASGSGSASATGTASGSTASATGKSSSSSTSSASASASTSDSGAMAFATGASQLVAGGAAMMIALAMA
ncbi:putative GPI anchored glycoprotein [Aspergillus ibericus CBS 121593]|uniref:GPI anchored protein n=1 Tax=Aspergillus ibericus CBS 121593 TaxID=1448316 RepID=A0A395H6R7_9EURO|nr:hypothetical protein BO80DRAFT_289020 [Aspergillus ibericus CBS 121593]RAL03622.1 hypothetical protein BO80DRAFT_289020 [Aspergillus ibericus CBS 121593]